MRACRACASRARSSPRRSRRRRRSTATSSPINPDRLLELQGDTVSPLSFFDPALEFPINPERVAPLLRNLVTPTRTRARIYDQGGLLILDSANIYARGEVLRSTPPPAGQTFFLVDWWNTVMSWVPGDDFPLYQEYSADEGKRYPEVAVALSGTVADIVRVDAQGQLVVSVAVPVQRLRATVGVLLLSTQPGDIDAIVAQERWGILRIALVAAGVTIILSLLLAGTIAGPIRRLSEAAEGVQLAVEHARRDPGFPRPHRRDRAPQPLDAAHDRRALQPHRGDRALCRRRRARAQEPADLAAISAVETLPRAKRPEDRERLNAIIQHDVRRLDRLISDISNACRLDAELARETAERVDVEKLAETMVSIQKDLAASRKVEVVLEKRHGRYAPIVIGHESRLAQVINNLIDNAISFSPEGGTVRVAITTTPTT